MKNTELRKIIQEVLLTEQYETQFVTPVKGSLVDIDHKPIENIDLISAGKFKIHWGFSKNIKSYGIELYPYINKVTGYIHIDKYIPSSEETENIEEEINISENINFEINRHSQDSFDIYPTSIEYNYDTKEITIKF